MLKQKRILILGCGAWQVPYIIRAKELGFWVCATDWSSAPPGAFYTDCFESIDLKDLEASLAFAQKMKIDGVLTAADIGVPTAAYIAGHMNLVGVPFELAIRATNKYAMRMAAKQGGVGIPWFTLINEKSDLRLLKLAYPLIVKPTDNSSSRGVIYVEDYQQLVEAVDNALRLSNEGRVLVEEFMIGVEGSAEIIVKDGRVYPIGICSKLKSKLPYRYDIELKYPGLYDTRQETVIHEFLTNLVVAFGIKNSIVHVEFVVDQSEVKLIEFALRGCGSNVMTHLLPELTGFDAITYLLLQCVGLPSEIRINKSKYGVLRFIVPQEGIIRGIYGMDEVTKLSGFVHLLFEKEIGDRIDFIKDGRSRPGYLMMSGNSEDELERNFKKAWSLIHIDME